MNLEPGHVLVIIGFFISILTKIIYDIKRENGQQWTIIGKLRDYDQEHEKESAQRRLELETKISLVRENSAKSDSKLDDILRRLTSIEDKIDSRKND